MQLIINYSLQKNNLYLYKFPLIEQDKKLKEIFIEDSQGKTKLDLDLSEVNWDIKGCLRQVFNNYNKEIIAVYS